MFNFDEPITLYARYKGGAPATGDGSHPALLGLLAALGLLGLVPALRRRSA